MGPDAEFESRVSDFERVWRLGGPGSVADFLGAPFAPGSPGRLGLLVELICVDLEYRCRNLGPASLGNYVDSFPELVSLDRLPLELIGEEYRARRRWGDRPSHEAFLSRFRERREAIRAELLRVDAEIEEESDGPAPGSRPAGPVDPGPGPECPLLSDRDFLLLRMIGAGRMGKVYRARPRDGGEDVAVKFLRKTLLRHPDAVRRFLGEARTVAGLRHPNIVGTRGLGPIPFNGA